METFKHTSDERLLSAQAVGEMLNLSKRQIFRMKSAGLICDCIKVGQGTIRWRKSDVERWIAQGCPDRKPNIGLIKKAMRMLGKNIRSARHGYFVGDTEIDIKTGKNADCKTIFVLSGREDMYYMRRWDDVEPDYIVKDLLEASKLITGKGKVKIIKKNSKIARLRDNRRRRKQGINLMRRSTDQ